MLKMKWFVLLLLFTSIRTTPIRLDDKMITENFINSTRHYALSPSGQNPNGILEILSHIILDIQEGENDTNVLTNILITIKVNQESKNGSNSGYMASRLTTNWTDVEIINEVELISDYLAMDEIGFELDSAAIMEVYDNPKNWTLGETKMGIGVEHKNINTCVSHVEPIKNTTGTTSCESIIDVSN